MIRLILVFLILFTSCSDKFIGIVKTTDINSGWQLNENGKSKVIPATVPGMVQTDLLNNGIIKTPLFEQNEKELQWISETDWKYSTEFIADDSLMNYKSVDIVFDGLDTYADVFLNGHQIASVNNMFRQWRVDGKKYLVKGTNKLGVVFYAPSLAGMKEMQKHKYTLPVNDKELSLVSPFVRKAAFQYGWDWSPRFLTMGIWKPVHIVAHDGVYISNIQVKTVEIADTCAWLIAYVTTVSDVDVRHAIITVRDAFREVRIRKGENVNEIRFRIFNPELWWPNGYGAQPLYNLTAKLFVDNYLVDSANTRLGIRTIELNRDEDEWGRNFYFRVNGLPVFIKGANYVPQSVFLTDVKDSDYTRLISDAQSVGINMLRVWGGGIYEKDLFYDLCDEKGILVWQDLMFANAMYPGDSSFITNAEQEVTYQIKRLRNHPSIALWCGNNEINVAWNNWGWQKSFNLSDADSAEIYNNYKKLFEEDFALIASENDNSRSYIPSSPISNWGKKENFYKGNMHYWGVWHGEEPIDSFSANVPRFMTEYGMQSYPSFASLKQNTGISRITLNSEFIKNRQRSYKGNRLLLKYIDNWYGNTGNVEDLCYLSQLNQAEAMRLAIESHRKSARFCMGSMYWQLNDVWDGASWSTIEYSGKWKAAHYSLKRLYAKDMLIHEVSSDSVYLYFQTESTKGRSGKLFVTVKDFYGRTVGSYTRNIAAGYLESDKVFAMELTELVAQRNQVEFFISARVIVDNELIAETIFTLDKPKNLHLPKSQIKVTRTEEESELKISVVSDVFAMGVFLYTENGEGTFSDNFFNLLPGVSKEVTITGTDLNQPVLVKWYEPDGGN